MRPGRGCPLGDLIGKQGLSLSRLLAIAVPLADALSAAHAAGIRRRGLRWLHRHGHLDDAAVHTLDASDPAGGWSEYAAVDIAEAEAEDPGPRSLPSDEGERRSQPGKIAARCWAVLMARIFAYLPLVCTRCGEPMRLIAFILAPPVTERILGHIGEPVEAPAVLPARSPPQGKLSFDAGIEAAAGRGAWPEIDQTGGGGDGWG